MDSVKTILRDLETTKPCEVLRWNKPIVSGIYAGSLFTFWLVFVVFEYTVTTMVARLATLSLIVGAALTFTKTLQISATDVSAHVDRVYDSVRPCVLHAVEQLINIVTWKDTMLSLKVVGGSFTVAFVGNYVSDAVLALLVLIVTFTAPLVYKLKKNEIDDLLAQVKQLADKYLAVLSAKGKTAAEKAEAAYERKNL
ncbi:reticulon domain protein, 22 kDa potentially aggravating protein (paple22) [Strigomonas culicis]|uniref:Reticulon-like protein n=1 Tax=Strigomonas culicis TaxID=28005 RepID=S9UCE8_9TRYP|nr:reticulon domain protein, 22 kDa potentially aggravating protein (paple22) [Strigomonas culicis]EPY33618.1 reticulon domain protein, 22 kDa potentially aggravating protein (paple22) [Strigomonas culicis]|eukprot:EPY28492.1 reticulon domain protein, 22 kDa potentially aggravating protein (paple22) [Strigomonas culicis]